MGNDGGSIPTRNELVRLKKKKVSVDSLEQDRTKWLSCALSKENLESAVVADHLGHIFSKLPLLKAIAEKTLPPQFSHIRGMKDIINIYFSPNSDYYVNREKDMGEEDLDSPFECPVTHLHVNGKHKFSVLKTCGHVFSQRGLSSISIGNNPACYICQAPYTLDDVLSLNPSADELVVMKAQLNERRKVAKRERKQKRKNTAVDEEDEKQKKRKASRTSPTTFEATPGLRNGALIVKVATKEAQEEHHKRKLASGTYRSIFSAHSSY
eukprot:TRINITY_DN1100_c0_g1_i5.p1 TRINITY_DN1100_c0_g1~~TRINITY_DN1100_c0_g1_i5.p1  ORF type:complete len:292 (-),score=52.54 TRINITY_DN1100_c0_g1_i5:153-953(-)